MMVGYADETVVGAESVGGRLRSAREAHGLSLDDIAARTRVPTRHLKAIEDDAFDQLPAAPYSVGFAKAFADAVGLNREEIGREFRAEKEGYGAADAGYSYTSDEPGPSGRGGILRLALILVIIAAIAFGLWMSGLFGGSAPVVAPPAAPQAPVEQPALPPAAPQAQPEAQAPTTPADDNSSQSEKSSSSSSQSDEQKTETGRSSTRTGASSDEGRTSRSSTNQSEPAATTTQEPPPKTTRQLNEEAAAKAAAPAAAPAPASATPPVIAPPAPAAAPDATP